MSVVLNGLQFGLVLALLIGPVFFTIIQTSVERGFRNGALVALGVSFSDTLYVVVCYLGLLQFLYNPQFKYYMAYVGGVILVLFGIYHLFIKSKRKMTASLEVEPEKNMYRYMVKGFLINALSPMVIIFWIGAISVASLDFGYTSNTQIFIFFFTVLVTVLITDLLKAFLADKLRSLITHRLMSLLNVIVGVCLIIFGVRLFFSAEHFLSTSI